jgi:hypothetical protein
MERFEWYSGKVAAKRPGVWDSIYIFEEAA